MTLSPSTIVVTGGSGMLGVHLVRRLVADGHDVLSIDLEPWAGPVAGFRHVRADITDAAAMTRLLDGARHVVHSAAALPSYPAAQIRAVTVDGTRTVFDAAVRAGAERTVLLSSTAAYGLPELVPTPEDYPRRPVDPYSRAKADAEELAEKLRAAGHCVPVLRPKTFLGPGRLGLFAMLFEWADEGRHFPVLGRGDVRTQMLDVADLVDAVVASLTLPADRVNATFNIAATEYGTLREDFQAVLDAAGHGKRVIGLPVRPAVAALRALDRAGWSPVYGRLIHKLLADSAAATTLAEERLGFRPRYSNRDTILRTYEWWRSGGPVTRTTGRTHNVPWKQGALAAAKVFF